MRASARGCGRVVQRAAAAAGGLNRKAHEILVPPREAQVHAAVPADADTSQRVLLRRGAIGQIRRGRLAFVAEVRSLAHVLGQTVGRTFQATCDAALGDARCGVDLEAPALKGTGAVIDLLRDRAFTASGLGEFEAGWFTFGTLDWTSGANAGRRTEVSRSPMSSSHGARPGASAISPSAVRAGPARSQPTAGAGWRCRSPRNWKLTKSRSSTAQP